MRKGSYQSIIYFIASVIMITLAIQVYWNYKNYRTGKQQLINEVQISLDNAVDEYFTELAKESTVFIMTDRMLSETVKREETFKNRRIAFQNFTRIDSFDLNKDVKISVVKDSATQNIHILKGPNLSKEEILKYQSDLMSHLVKHEEDNKSYNKDSINDVFKSLASKAIISIAQDSLNLSRIDTLVFRELSRKNINIDYGLKYTNSLREKKEINTRIVKSAVLQTTSKSSFLPEISTLELFFVNEKLTIFKKNLVGILLSFILLSAVIASLLFLLRIINKQKQLAELKNDLISNITHEFKTPIATINAALEGIQNFNPENDPEKTKKYVEMSSNQLYKLNIMVEKILETATLDSDKLQLDLEDVDIISLIKSISQKHKNNTPNKSITFTSSHSNMVTSLDVFHFENAINNIIDNAIKYGGSIIGISIKKTSNHITIEITDNGSELTKAHKDRIFEKFYRVPKGNTHNIKGFGIGLFYTKIIVEKHNGVVQLILDKGLTNFKITLPNE